MDRLHAVACVALCLIAVLLAGCAHIGGGTRRDVDIVVAQGFYEKPPRQMVVDVSGDIEGEVFRRQVEDIFTMELLRRGYLMLDRGTLEGRSGAEVFLPAAELRMEVRVSDGNRVGWSGRVVDTDTANILLMASFTGRGWTASEESLSDGMLGGRDGRRALSVRTRSGVVEDAGLMVGGMPAPSTELER